MVDDAPVRRRRGGGLYPLWLGGAALIGFTALWLNTADDAPPVADAAVDAAVEPPAADEKTAPEPPPTRLEWTIGPRPPMDAAALDGCLADAGYDRAAAVGIDPIVVTFPGRIRPISVRVTALDDQPAVLLSTPVEADARLSATLHVAATACLYAEGAEVYDPLFDRRLAGRDWPQLGPTGGLPVHHLLMVDTVTGGLRTRGLMRLGRPELGLAVGPGLDEAAALRVIQSYGAAAVVAPVDAPRLDGGGDFARRIDPASARAAGWWRAPHDPAVELQVLADAEADPPEPVALSRAAPARPSKPAPPSKPPPDTRRPARPDAPTPRPAPRPEPKPKAPVPFSPAYR